MRATRFRSALRGSVSSIASLMLPLESTRFPPAPEHQDGAAAACAAQPTVARRESVESVSFMARRSKHPLCQAQAAGITRRAGIALRGRVVPDPYRGVRRYASEADADLH